MSTVLNTVSNAHMFHAHQEHSCASASVFRRRRSSSLTALGQIGFNCLAQGEVGHERLALQLHPAQGPPITPFSMIFNGGTLKCVSGLDHDGV